MPVLDGPIRPGDTGRGVRVLHAFLELVDRPLPDEERAVGAYGEATYAAVRSLQDAFHLPPTGTLDEETSRRLELFAGAGSRRGVTGLVGGRVRPGLMVRLLDRNLAGDTALAEPVQCKADGSYTAGYDLATLGRPGKRAADLLSPELVPGEWEWHRNYRVWEANRRVFLYPENYLEPELRDDKTPLFADVEAELLLHLPVLVANRLNAEQRFAAAQRCYHYVFDPASAESGPDRVWRCREFRGRTVESLRAALTDGAALDAYRKDPFNPHAIARARLNAYQKSTVMKYVDNLLDWGDSLFAEFTTESVNEETMLYVLAADILGPQPQPQPPLLGDCGEEAAPRTYADIEPFLGKASDLLIELENLAAPIGQVPFPWKPKHSTVRALLHTKKTSAVREGDPVLAVAMAAAAAAGRSGWSWTRPGR